MLMWALLLFLPIWRCSWCEMHHKQFQLYLCSFLCLSAVSFREPSTQVVREDFIWVFGEGAGYLPLRRQVCKRTCWGRWMKWDFWCMPHLLWISIILIWWFFIGWIAQKESTGAFDALFLQIVSPPRPILAPKKVYENLVFAKALNQYKLNLLITGMLPCSSWKELYVKIYWFCCVALFY